MAEAVKQILVTSFGPFRGRAKNGSQTLARWLAKRHSELEIRFLELNVVWGEVEKVVLPEIERFEPEVVIALGEGAPQEIRVERRAKNLRAGTDEDGREMVDAPIDSRGPESRGSRFPDADTGREFGDAVLKDSEDCGTFLCNNTLYRVLETNVPVAAFIHLPPQEDVPDEDYATSYGPALDHLLGKVTGSEPT